MVLGSIDSSACRLDTDREWNNALKRDGTGLLPLEDLPTANLSSVEENASILGIRSSCLAWEPGGLLGGTSVSDTLRIDSSVVSILQVLGELALTVDRHRNVLRSQRRALRELDARSERKGHLLTHMQVNIVKLTNWRYFEGGRKLKIRTFVPAAVRFHTLD